MMNQSLERALKLAVVTGMRSMLGPALVARAANRPEHQSLALAAMGEMIFDKIPGVPGRHHLFSLLIRGMAGAWVANNCMKEDGVEDPWAAPLGAAVAMGVAVAAPRVRESVRWTTGIPDVLLGVAEDYLALRVGCDAVGIPLESLREVASESIEDLRERTHSTADWFEGAQSLVAGSM